MRRTKKTDGFVVGNDGVAAATADLFRIISRYPPMVILLTVCCCCLVVTIQIRTGSTTHDAHK